jgi:hypothetical protein
VRPFLRVVAVMASAVFQKPLAKASPRARSNERSVGRRQRRIRCTVPWGHAAGLASESHATGVESVPGVSVTFVTAPSSMRRDFQKAEP